MTIIGIDPGMARLGVVVLDKDGKILHNAFWAPPCRGVKRLQWIESAVSNLMEKHKVTDAVVEGYSFMSKWRAHELGEVGGVLRLLFHKKKIPFSVVAPPTLKKFATGKGNTKKEFLVLHVYKKWGEEFKTIDEADAYALCRWLMENGHAK